MFPKNNVLSSDYSKFTDLLGFQNLAGLFALKILIFAYSK